jgi:hypothetical protein
MAASIGPGALVVVAVGLLSAPLQGQGQPAGYVKVVTGAALIIRSGAETAARPGDAVYQKDGLRTGADGRLGITLKDDTRVSLGPNSECALSEFKFSPAQGELGLVMRLLRGVAAFVTGRIGELRPDAVRIETPATIIGVRGTHIVVQAEGY